jgi:hypothetical protein
MALRIARGLFRMWLVLSALWIGGVGVVSWWTFPQTVVPYVDGQTHTSSNGKQYVYDASANEWLPVTETHTLKPSDQEVAWAARNAEARRAEILYDTAVALIPPVLLLALGSALGWAFRGFR